MPCTHLGLKDYNGTYKMTREFSKPANDPFSNASILLRAKNLKIVKFMAEV